MLTPRTAPSGYGPADLRSAYGITATGSAASTIAIIDAFDDPRAESDLAVYRSRFGLPPCTTANKCFRKMDQAGGARYPAADAGWAGEISLDLDMASAICPGCRLLLVEAAAADLNDLGTAVNTAAAAGAKYISNSYGGAEDTTDPASATSYFNHPGVAITASAGDSGYGVEYPASAGTVTAVGGTSLVRGANSRGWTETVWNTEPGEGTGSGCSAWMAKPRWQTDTGCARRTVADVAAVADPDTGVAVYDTYQSSGWDVYGGTSAAAPIIAAVYALAGTPGVRDYPAAYPYQHPNLLWDMTSGSDGACAGTYLCTARFGYDGPTGLGSPHGVGAFKAPVAASINGHR
jgi:subtilase family serine protease